MDFNFCACLIFLHILMVPVRATRALVDGAFYYKPKNSEKMVDHRLKFGEDRLIEKRKTLRDFLDE